MPIYQKPLKLQKTKPQQNEHHFISEARFVTSPLIYLSTTRITGLSKKVRFLSANPTKRESLHTLVYRRYVTMCLAVLFTISHMVDLPIPIIPASILYSILLTSFQIVTATPCSTEIFYLKLVLCMAMCGAQFIVYNSECVV